MLVMLSCCLRAPCVCACVLDGSLSLHLLCYGAMGMVARTVEGDGVMQMPY